uniref:Uncharacterized protein n=1 Tax=viral metagenome TaxID=1070528 RepID=A0A6C0BXJ5_9ZZZZ
MGSCSSKVRHPSIPTNIDPKALPNFIPPITEGRVIKCYDGDTITIAAFLPYKASPLYKFSVRLAGILPRAANERCKREINCYKGKGCVNRENIRKNGLFRKSLYRKIWKGSRRRNL